MPFLRQAPPTESEKLFRNMADTAPVMIWISDSIGEMVYVNKGWLDFTGRIFADEIGNGWMKNVHPDDVEMCLTQYRNAFAQLEPFRCEYRLLRADRTYGWVLNTATPRRNEKNEFLGYIGTCIDITEKKAAEKELETYKERLEVAQFAGGIGTFEWNMKTNSLWFSKEQMNLYHIDETTFNGKLENLQNSTYTPDKQDVQEAIVRAAANHQNFDKEFRICLPDGSIRWIRGKGRYFYDKNDEPVRMIGINYDITGRRQLEELLHFKVEASRVLSSSLDYEHTLQTVATLAVKHIADWCSVDMVDEEGYINAVAIAHVDPKKVEWAKKLRREQANHIKNDNATAQVLRSGKPLFLPVVTDDLLVKGAKNEQELRLLRKIGLSSIMIVPIQLKGQSIGVLSFVTSDSKRHYEIADLETAEQLASRAAMAIENATLYEQVQSERQRLQKLVANVTGVVWETEGPPDDDKMIFVSSYAEKMMGYPLEKWQKEPHFWLQLIHPDDRAAALAKQKDIYENGTRGINRYRWVSRKGVVRWIESHMSVISDEDDKKIGMRGVSMDISSRMEIERRKDEFISMASHELKTPLTSIKVLNQVLLQNPEIQSQTSVLPLLSRMDQQINRLTNLVADLLDVTKIQVGRLPLNKKIFNLNVLINEVVEVMQTTTTKHMITLKSPKKVQLLADSDRIEQVLTNLLSNAIKYSPDNAKITVEVTPPQHGFIQIRVKDRGIGIPKDQQPRIFERFYRVFDATDQTFPGLGMGLYITAEIVRRHDGLINVRSTPGKGSTFTVSLPIT